MKDNRKKIKVDEETYKEFRGFIKRTKGKIRGELSPAIEEALKLYMEVHQDPDLRSNIYDQLRRGHGCHPLDHDGRAQKFYDEFLDRFDGYPLIGSGELNTWIKSYTGSYSETALKKWRGRLRDKGLILYLNNGLWKIPGNATDNQSTLPRSHDYVYSLLEPGKMVSVKKLEKVSGLEGEPLKKLIIKLEDENKLKSTTPGLWDVLEPDYSI